MNHETAKPEDTHGLDKICCHETETETRTSPETKANQLSQNRNHFLGICIVIAAMIIGVALILTSLSKVKVADGILSAQAMAALEKTVLPNEGVILPIKWGDLGKQLVDNGTISQQKFEALYVQRGGLDETAKKLLTGTNNGRLVITKDNAHVMLNLLWALGLANKNVILEKGPMVDKQYGGDASKFASTGGWTLAAGNTMNHYNRHQIIPLTPEQQSLVESVSKNIYRPCCSNSTYFPDCNHGMAMLGLLELMASQNATEADMYKAALAVNSYWFPDTYVTIAQYLKAKGIAWKDASPQGILSREFSSASGYQQIKSQVVPAEPKRNNSCSA